MIDGPQGFASVGKSLRDCEKQCGAVGKTPDVMPMAGKPFAGFIRSSIELFSAFDKAGIVVGPSDFLGGVSEVYPGNLWTRLARGRLPKKSCNDGRGARKLILEALGVVGLPDSPTHDENDACISALIGAAADSKIRGVNVSGIGLPLVREQSGTMREGRMVIPEISEEVAGRIDEALRQIQRSVLVISPISRQSSVAPEVMERAVALRDTFIQRAKEGSAQICTYAWAYGRLFDSSLRAWSRAYAKKVLSVARNTPPAELQGLGAVKLDAFIVAGKTGFPGTGHWESAGYNREAWERVLGTATLLKK